MQACAGDELYSHQCEPYKHVIVLINMLECVAYVNHCVDIVLQDNVPSTSSEEHVKNVDQVALTSRFTISEDAKKAKERFIEKEREQARTEAKKRKLDEKKVSLKLLSFLHCQYCHCQWFGQ